VNVFRYQPTPPSMNPEPLPPGEFLSNPSAGLPVMGYGQGGPRCIAEGGLLGTRGVAKVEFPSVVETLAALAVVGLNESAARPA